MIMSEFVPLLMMLTLRVSEAVPDSSRSRPRQLLCPKPSQTAAVSEAVPDSSRLLTVGCYSLLSTNKAHFFSSKV